MFNFDELDFTTHTVSSEIQVYNESGTEILTTEFVASSVKIPLRKSPSNSSEIVSNLNNGVGITMQREWATGNNHWSYVKVSSGSSKNQEGYILTKYLKQKKANWANINLPKANIEVTKMTDIAKALIPAFYELDNPYYHKENGEWWVPVTLNQTCFEEGSLSQYEIESKAMAAKQLYNYLSIPTEIDGNSTQWSLLAATPLGCHVEDYYLSTRPGSKLKVLVAIPAIYIQHKLNQLSDQLSESINEDLCMTIPLASLDDMAVETQECLQKMYQQYLDSNLYSSEYNFEQEILKQINGISGLKLLLRLNSISYNSPFNQSNRDYSPCDNQEESLKICFNENYTLKTVIHIDTSGKEKVLSKGLSSMRNSYPWNDSGFGILFFKQSDLCEFATMPGSTPSVQEYFNEYTVETKEGSIVSSKKIAPIDYNKGQSKSVGDFGKNELGIALTTASVLQGVASSLNMVLGLDEGSDPICFDSSKECAEFKKRAIQDRDSKHILAGDFLSNFKFICDFDYQNADEDGIHDGVTRYIGGLNDWVFGLFGLGDLDVGDFPAGTFDWELSFPELSAIRFPTLDPLGAIKEISFKKLLEFVEDIVFKIVGFVIKLLCDLLLTILINSLLIGLGILAAYGLYLLLKDDDEGGEPHPSVLAMKNYGAEDANEIFKESFGVSDEGVYEIKLGEMFDECGIPMTPQQSKQYLASISEIVSPIEMLSLFNGKATLALLGEVLEYTKDNSPEVYQYKDSEAKLASFFACIGTNVSSKVSQRVESDIAAQFQDPDLCASIKDELKNIMKEKCPNPDIYNSIYEKEFSSDADKYKKVVSLLQDECNNLVPSFFNNPETGEAGILSSSDLKPNNMDAVLDSLAETIMGSSKDFLKIESANYFTKYGDKFKDFVGEGGSDGVLLQSDLVVRTNNDAGIGGKTYKYNSQAYSFTNPVPVIRLYSDGRERVKIDQGVTLGTPSIMGDMPESVVSIRDNYEQNYIASVQTNNDNISMHQRIFYSMIQDYFINNSKNPPFPHDANYSNLLDCEFPLPYSGLDLNKPSSSKWEDHLFSLIFIQNAERIARRVGFSWNGTEEELQEYSKNLQGYAQNIIGYEKSKKEMLRYYDLGDYDDPNDNTSLGAKQYSLLHGILYFYSRVYIFEYLAKSMPFYASYDYPKDYYNYSEISIEYVVRMMQEGLGAKFQEYNDVFNEVFDFIKLKSEVEITQFSGNHRGLKYYVSENFNDVSDLFEEYIEKGIPSDKKKTKNSLEYGIFLAGTYSNSSKQGTPLILDVHSYAGTPALENSEIESTGFYESSGQSKLLIDNGNDLSNIGPSLKGEEFFVDLSGDSYSLFGSNYKYFKNGMFFVQNYITFQHSTTDGFDDYNNRPNNLKGYINNIGLNELDALLADGLYNTPGDQEEDHKKFKLNQLFTEGTVKYGSRLCYGIAYDSSDDSADPEVQEFAKNFFKNYTSNYNDKGGIYSDDQRKAASDLSAINKYLVCVDGPSATYIVDDALSLSYSKKGTFSIVIPVFNREMDIDGGKTWGEFTNEFMLSTAAGFAGMTKFQNLNNDLFNSDEYFALKEKCFSLKNILHFNAFSGLAYYGDSSSLKNALFQTKLVINSSIDIVAKGAKDNSYGYKDAIKNSEGTN